MPSVAIVMARVARSRSANRAAAPGSPNTGWDPPWATGRSQVIASIAGDADSRTPESVSMSKWATITPGT